MLMGSKFLINMTRPQNIDKTMCLDKIRIHKNFHECPQYTNAYNRGQDVTDIDKLTSGKSMCSYNGTYSMEIQTVATMLFNSYRQYTYLLLSTKSIVGSDRKDEVNSACCYTSGL